MYLQAPAECSQPAMGRRPKLPPNASCSCISCSPTGRPPRGEVGRRPASGRSSRPGTSPPHGCCGGSHGSAARSRCWYGCASGARREKRSRSAFPQCRPHSRRSPPKQQLFRTSAPVAAQVDAVHVDVWIVPALQRAVAPVFNVDVGFLVQLYNFLRHSLLSRSEWCVVTSFYQSLHAMSSFMRFSICASYCTLSYNKVCLIK